MNEGNSGCGCLSLPGPLIRLIYKAKDHVHKIRVLARLEEPPILGRRPKSASTRAQMQYGSLTFILSDLLGHWEPASCVGPNAGVEMLLSIERRCV